MNVLGKRIRAERELKKSKDPKWTQDYVANLIGVARPTYTAYENGTKEPPLDTLNKIANLFKISCDYLLGRTDNPSSPSEEKDNKKLETSVHNPKHATFIKEYLASPEERRKELLQFWRMIKDAEKGRELRNRQDE